MSKESKIIVARVRMRLYKEKLVVQKSTKFKDKEKALMKPLFFVSAQRSPRFNMLPKNHRKIIRETTKIKTLFLSFNPLKNLLNIYFKSVSNISFMTENDWSPFTG